MTDKMNKILIVGLGSMGKRRIRNLQKLGYRQLIGFDLRDDRIIETKKKYKIKCFNNFQNALTEKPNMMLICTPPNLHKEYAKKAIQKNIHVFLELNLAIIFSILFGVQVKPFNSHDSCVFKSCLGQPPILT